MYRREFITLLGSAAAWPLAAFAQQRDRARLVGALMNGNQDELESHERLAAFEDGLTKQGWRIGRNLWIEYRWGAGNVERAQGAVAELLRSSPEVILANGSTSLRALHQATRTVPIVFTLVSEPVAQGFVESLARPNGNVTGFTNLEPTVAAKWLELLRELVPGLMRVALLFNPRTAPYTAQFFDEARAAAAAMGLEMISLPLNDSADIERTLSSVAHERHSGLIVMPDTFTTLHRKAILDFASQSRLPAIYAFRFFTAEGGLASYGVDSPGQFRQAAVYVDRILRGETAGKLPVQQPTKFQLVINLRTAKTLALRVPDSLLARADEVIE
jgi:putative ABC transport system substrate-binding protein